MFRWEPEGRYHCTKSMAIAPRFWFSMEYRWTALTPFWLSADDFKMWLQPLSWLWMHYIILRTVILAEKGKALQRSIETSRLGGWFIAGNIHVWCARNEKQARRTVHVHVHTDWPCNRTIDAYVYVWTTSSHACEYTYGIRKCVY